MIQGKTSGSEQPNAAKSVEIPKGWNRILDNGFVVYISPSNGQLRSLDQVIEYLKKDGTCKCGLECPLYVHKIFNFDKRVPSRYKTQMLIEQQITTCKLCKELSVNEDKSAFQEQAAKKTSKSKQAPGKAKAASGGGSKGSSQSRSKTEVTKPKRVTVSRPRQPSPSSLTDVPSPPITTSSPVQNVPTNLGGSNQGPLPSFASIVSSSKFFNPGPNRGPLQPTSQLPPVSLLTAGKLKAAQSTSVQSPVQTSVQVNPQATITVVGTKLSQPVTSVAQVGVASKSVPASSMVTMVTMSSVTGVAATTMPSSIARASTADTISTIVATSKPLVVSHPQAQPVMVAPRPQMTPITANTTTMVKPKALPKSRAKPRPKAAPRGLKARKAELQRAALAFPNPAIQMPTPVAMQVGLQGINVQLASKVSSSWPASSAATLTGGASRQPAAATVTTMAYQSPLTSVVTVAAPIQNVQPTKPPTKPAAMTTQVWVPLSQLSNHQQSAKHATQTQVVASSSVRPHHQQSVVMTAGEAITPASGIISSPVTTMSAPITVPAPISVSAQKLQAPPGMMYVTAKPTVLTGQGPYNVAASLTTQGSQVQPVTTSTLTSNGNTPSSSQVPTAPKTVPTFSTQSAQGPGKVNVQMPAMYTAGGQVLPLNVQNFDMSQYKGAMTYQLSAGTMLPGTGMVGNTMAFIAQPTKASFAGVPTITPASQLNYPNPYMLSIVMPTTNSTSSSTSTTTSAAATTVMPLAMMQAHNVQNPAVAAAYDSFVPIAPASGGSGPRFAQTLAHLASAYNSFTPHGMVPNLQFTYRMMQMSALSGNSHGTAMAAPSVVATTSNNSAKPANASSDTSKAQIQKGRNSSNSSQVIVNSGEVTCNQPSPLKPQIILSNHITSANVQVGSGSVTSQSTFPVSSQTQTSTISMEVPRVTSHVLVPSSGNVGSPVISTTPSSAATETGRLSGNVNGPTAFQIVSTVNQQPLGQEYTVVTCQQNHTPTATGISNLVTCTIPEASSKLNDNTYMVNACMDTFNKQEHKPLSPRTGNVVTATQHQIHSESALNASNTHFTAVNSSVGIKNCMEMQLPALHSSPLNDNKRTSESSSDKEPEAKRPKYDYEQRKYYEANPLLGMKRSCDAIEVANNPPVEGELSSDDKEGYSSSNEDINEEDIKAEEWNLLDKAKDIGDASAAPDNFKRNQQMYNGGTTENHALGHPPVLMGVPLKPPPLPEMQYRMDIQVPLVKQNFEIGDVVWAQARGLPSWPGQIVDESRVGKGKADDGKRWVMWYGDHTFSQVEVDKLKSLNEGLRNLDEKARKKKYRAKRTRISLEQAINEALGELEMRNRLNVRQGMTIVNRTLYS